MIEKTNTDTKKYIAQAIMLGWQRHQIDQWAASQSPPIGSAEIDRAYAECVNDWIIGASLPDEQLYALHVARRENLYRQAMADSDLSLAHKILIDQARIQQQYKQDKVARERKEKIEKQNNGMIDLLANEISMSIN